MKYRIVITPEAERDLRTAYQYIRNHAPKAARTWIKGARQTIKSLQQNPERGHLAPESTSFQEPIREIVYGRGNRGTYRMLFVVIEKTVFLLHVRHGSMLPFELEQDD